MTPLRLLLSLLGGGLALYGQPLITPRGILNAASFIPAGLPGGAIARGSIFSIFGQRMGPATPVNDLRFPLQTTLGGVSIRITQGAAGVDAIPVYVSAGQINAIMPSNAPLGMASVQVSFNGIRGAPSPVRIVNSSFGVFTATGAGVGPGILQNFNSEADQPINTPRVSARPGQAITLWGTGLGPVSRDEVAPSPGDLPTRVEIFVGGRPARRLYSGRTPCCSGTDQIVFEVPPDAPSGCYVPVQIRTEGSIPGNSVTMAIHPEGLPCNDASAPANRLVAGGRIGLAGLVRSEFRAQSQATVTDYSVTLLRQETGATFAFNPLLALPPPGSCAVYAIEGDAFSGRTLPLAAPSGLALDPGNLQISGLRGVRNNVRPPNLALGFAHLGFNVTGVNFASTLMLEPGDITVAGNGGPDVGAFRSTIPMVALLGWTNRSAAIDRSQDYPVNWSGVPAGHNVLIAGGSMDISTNSSTVFVCAASGGSSFAIPSYVLQAVPPFRNAFASQGLLYVTSMPAAPQSFSAPGLDAGFLTALTTTGGPVRFR